MPVIEITHPLVQHKLGLMRQVDTSTKSFRELAAEIACLLTYEATRDLATEPATVQGWAGPVEVRRIAGKMITLVPILRAGLGMLEGVLGLIPGAKVSVVGLQRDETTHHPRAYYENLVDDIAERTALVLDPMLATGGSLAACCDLLRAAGCRRIKALCLVSAPEGLALMAARHPEVAIHVAAIDRCLNENAYILPGLGDAGDRIFGTRPD